MFQEEAGTGDKLHGFQLYRQKLAQCKQGLADTI
jgi:hypothetical protein